MLRRRWIAGLGWITGIVLGALLGGCGDDPEGTGLAGAGLVGPGPGPGAGPISVELSGSPSVTYDSTSGRTTVVVQFIPRGADGVPLAAADVGVALKVDGQQVDNESVLQQSSQELSSSLLYALVLDASGSMPQQKAFVPMKQSARDSVQTGIALWENRAGSFSWDLCWFNDFLYQREEPWLPEDIMQIPEPSLDAPTKLYSAVDSMAARLRNAYQAGKASGPRDQHVMVVLSDGADNYSWFDNAQTAPSTSSTGSGARYQKLGWKATSLNDAITAVQAHPKLTVHVLAMGAELKPEDLDNLQKLATAGKGKLLVNPQSSGTTSLFERVTKEFSTLQTRGASIPQQPGDHEFALAVTGKSGGTGTYAFRYRAGPDAQVLP